MTALHEKREEDLHAVQFSLVTSSLQHEQPHYVVLMSKIYNIHLHPGKCPQFSSIFIFHQADSWHSSQQSRVDSNPLWKRPQLGFPTGYLAEVHAGDGN